MVNTRLQVFHGTGKPMALEHKDLEFDPAPGEALVAIDLATICGSDLHTIDGTRTERTPCVLGHEAIGRIVQLGSGRDLAPGDRVTWSIADSCGRCAACTTHGLPQKCQHLFKYGHAPLGDGTGHNGCYASHIVLRPGTHIARVPDKVPDHVAAPANCALATMVNAISQLPSSPGSVLIQGGGLLGLYGCALLQEAGVEQIYCTEVDGARRKLIEQFGGVPIDAAHAEQEISSRHPQGVDAVIEVAGVKSVVEEGINLCRIGGSYIFVGLVHPDSALDITAETIIRKCLTLRGVHNYAPGHLDAALAFLERQIHHLPFEALVAPPEHLENLAAAIELAKTHQWARVSLDTSTA
ncbi:MAG: zinc-binding dehydrogenase [Planctomycetota bacterium]|nr:zinc-binding dehydrogenase [Planctomycetota bacterium]